ncbi:MAG: hypothetical protein KDA96_01160 [Planctomycetaceae bacterium]|nr:hypothetical protein [Planctomycetaceae bacterium]
MPHVIAVCGSMGSGKTTVVRHLSQLLPQCAVLFEDDFNRTPERSLEEIQAWFDRGADVSEFDLSAFGHAIDRCLRNNDCGNDDTPGGFLLLESQFGRTHPLLRSRIDLQCWIDVPLDVAIVRKLEQISSGLQQDRMVRASDGLSWIADFCHAWLTSTRQLVERQRKDVRQCSDIRINGMREPHDVVRQILDELPMRQLINT